MRACICCFRAGPDLSAAPGGIARHSMHQQVLGPPGPPNSASKSGQREAVTGWTTSRPVISVSGEIVFGLPDGGEDDRGVQARIEAHGAGECRLVGAKERVGGLFESQAHRYG